MGDTRIDGSTPRTAPECDEDTGVCGAVKKAEPEPQGSVDYIFDDRSHVPSDPKPTHLAEIAKNMSAPKPPTDAELRATYEKTSDAELEKEVKTLGKRLSDGGQYSGADLDTRKFHAAEAVAKNRADAARPAPSEQGESTEHFFPFLDEAMHRGKHVTVGHLTTEWTIEHRGIQATAVHGEGHKDFGNFDLSVSGDVVSAGVDQSTHNADGSRGFQTSGGVTVIGGEVTAHKRGLGSVTLGASAGASVEASAGLKQDGDMLEGCVRISAGVGTYGLCIPMMGEKK